MSLLLTCLDCGHVGRYGTKALADFHFPRHSCALVRERRARAKRRIKRATSSGESRECEHPRAQHQHGTHAAYVLDRCRCRPCRDATSAYERDRTRRILYGRSTMVPAGEVRIYVHQLMRAGMGLKRICEVAGVSTATLGALVYGKPKPSDPRERRPLSRKVRKATADALLAVTVDLAPGARVDGTGTTRRVQALVATGWSMSKIATELGVTPANFAAVAHGRRDVTRRTADAVRALYDRLWDEQPPQGGHRDRIAYSRSVRYATLHGWASPLAWDDDQIDDPDAQPAAALSEDVEDLDDVVIMLAMQGRPVRATRAERAEITRRWRAAGRTLAELDRLQGWNVHRDRRAA